MVEFTPEQLFKVSFSLILFVACCMNASDVWSDRVYRFLNHVTDTDMFLVQSAVTCGAFVWYVYSLSV